MSAEAGERQAADIEESADVREPTVESAPRSRSAKPALERAPKGLSAGQPLVARAPSRPSEPRIERAPVRKSEWGTSGAVIDAWRLLAVHSRDCEACEKPTVELRQVADQPAAVYDRLCEEGRALFAAWDEPKRELPRDAGPADRLLESIRGIRRMFEYEGLDEVDAERRNRALARIPPGAFLHLKQLPHDERMAQVRALERAEPSASAEVRERSTAARPESTAVEERLCANEDCARGPYGTRAKFRPVGERQRFCCRSCRQTEHRQTLLETE
ncbi:MAG TPA: hypothetical protein VOB72_04000 [Candidatus Dormibacteraeota bacterium]|nr:hypothetical protein [Candidatus Dormibacteraeota bacterium]